MERVLRKVLFTPVPLVALFVLLYSTLSLSQSKELSSVPSAETLISQLGIAIREQSYHGVFTFEYSGKLETFGIDHLVEDGVEREYLYRTTGAEQQYYREGLLSCGTIGGNLLKGRQLTSSNGGHYGLKHYYRFGVAGTDRVAGREAWVVQLVPSDEFRYGLSFSIDKESHLLLRYVVFDAQKHTALERMQFASLELDPNPSLLSSIAEGKPQLTTYQVASHQCVGARYSPEGHSPWKPTWLPPGYLLTGYTYSDSEGHMETYTDGLSSFSIFVNNAESAQRSDRQVHQGVSSKGAITALLSFVPYKESMLSVSVVGEIPPRVAQRITLSLAQVQEAKEDLLHDD